MLAKIEPQTSKFEWSLNDNKINIDNTNIKVVQNDNILTLSINKLNCLHAGKWCLTAFLNNESDSDSINLIILGK